MMMIRLVRPSFEKVDKVLRYLVTYILDPVNLIPVSFIWKDLILNRKRLFSISLLFVKFLLSSLK